MRRLLRRIFLVGPCRLYQLGESTGGSVPLVFVLGLLGCAAALGGLFALIAVLTGASAEDYFFTGAIAGLLAITAWALYAVLVLVGLWLRGISPATYVDLPASTGRHASTTPDEPTWRRRGDPLVPAGLIAFFALMAAVFFADGYFSADQGPFEAPLATAPATILRYDDGPGGFGDRYLEVRFTANGREYTTKVKAEDRVEESRVPDPGGTQQVEYVITNPTQARPAGATQSKRSDAHFSRNLSYTCAILTALSAAAYLLSRHRRRADPQP
ncbi:hypothetical protein [Kribbella lupini]